jgi:hypothetical protein
VVQKRKNGTGVVSVFLWFPKKRAPTYSAPETTPKNHKKKSQASSSHESHIFDIVSKKRRQKHNHK